MGLFDSLKKGLEKTRNNLMGGIEQLFGAYDEVDDDFYEELEETLVLADMGMTTSVRLVENLRKEAMQRRLKRPEEVKELLMQSSWRLETCRLQIRIG